MEEELNYNVTVDCGHSDYSSDFSEIQTQLLEIKENQVILTDTIKGGNSILLLILAFFIISCIYRLLKSIF